MTSIVNDNKGCCSHAPVQAEYTPKGSFSDVAGLNTYITGPASAKTAIIFAFDIFKFSPQALQGADMLASKGRKVIMPDFLKGREIDPALFERTDAEAETKKQAFFSGPASPPLAVSFVSTIITDLKTSGVTKIGGVGFCWGAKACILAAGENVGLDAVGLVHPSMMQSTDAEPVQIPVCLLPSKEEDATLMSALESTLRAKPFAEKNVYKTFSESVHGWAGARGDLKTEKGKKDFQEAYDILDAFLKRRLFDWKAIVLPY